MFTWLGSASVVDVNWFLKLDWNLEGNQFYSNERVEIIVHEWLWMKEPDFCHDGIFKLMPRWVKYICVPRDYFEEWCYLNGLNELYLT